MTKQRPLAITVICILVFIGSLISIALEVSLLLRGDSTGNPLSRLLIVLLGLVPFVGLWKMKKWSILLFTVGYAIGQVWLLVTGQWTPATLLPLIVIAIGFYYYRQMD